MLLNNSPFRQSVMAVSIKKEIIMLKSIKRGTAQLSLLIAGVFASAVAMAQETPTGVVADLGVKLTEAQTVMTFFIGVAVVWAGYRMVKRVIR
jgi:hypothetical protein